MAERRHVKPTRHLKLFVNAYIHNIFFKLEIKPKGNETTPLLLLFNFSFVNLWSYYPMPQGPPGQQIGPAT